MTNNMEGILVGTVVLISSVSNQLSFTWYTISTHYTCPRWHIAISHTNFITVKFSHCFRIYGDDDGRINIYFYAFLFMSNNIRNLYISVLQPFDSWEHRTLFLTIRSQEHLTHWFIFKYCVCIVQNNIYVLV